MASELRPIEKAPAVGRRLLGVLLAQRRTELGYTHRPAFARARLPVTPSGNLNTRLVADIEEAYRDNFPEPRLRQLARAYLVSYESLIDVAHLRHNLLVPVSPDDARPAYDEAPPLDPERAAANRRWYKEINERRVALAGKGNMNPTGAQMFPGAPNDAMAWDGIGARFDIDDRVWFIAVLRRNAAERGGNSGTGATGA